MRKTKIAALAAVIAITALFSTGCATYNNFKDAFFGAGGETAETLKIGVLEPQTGNDSPMGDLEIQGIQLANQLMPEILGKKVELVYADTQSSIYVAETAVEDLIDKEPAVVLGSYGDTVSLIASRALGEAGIPAITITATNPLITANNEFYFRVSFTDASQGQAMAHYVYEHLKQKTAGVIKMQDEDTATEMVSEFNKELTELTDNPDCVEVTIEIPKDTGSYDAYVKELQESGVSVVFMPASLKHAEKMFKAVEKAGLTDITFLGPKEWRTEKTISLQQKYPGIKIAVASDFVTADNQDQEAGELYQAFLKAYAKEYGSGEPPEAVVLGFDAYMIAAEAINRAGSIDGNAVREALQATIGFEGASGEISFNESGEPKKTINIDIVEENKFVSVYTVK